MNKNKSMNLKPIEWVLLSTGSEIGLCGDQEKLFTIKQVKDEYILLRHREIEDILNKDKVKFLPLIHHLIFCEDSYFSN